MADIELVIKISEETYKDIQSRDWKNAGRWFSEEWTAIHNGTQLPKEHGRLIDVSEYFKKEFGDAREFLDKATTIIEADTAESEDKDEHFMPIQSLTCDDINDIIDES